MKLKRLATMALAGVMTLSLAVPAFASGSTTVTAVYSSPTIDVDVPTTGAAIINPFGLDVKMDEDPTDNTNQNKVTITGQKIVTAPMALKNKTQMNLSVNATLTGAITSGSDMRLAAEALAADDTSKSAFVYLQAAPTTLAGNATAVTAAAIGTAYAAWEAAPYDENTDVILGTRAVTKDGLVILKAAQMNSTSGAFDQYKAGSIALVRLAGDAVASPRTPWANTDGFTATIAYTFVPVQLPTFDITAGTMSHASPATIDPAIASIKVENKVVTKASAGDQVDVEVTVDDNADGITWTIVDAEGNPIAGLTGDVGNDGATKSRTFNFTMPEQAVKINIESNGK